jgi:hypothetical protein
MCLIIDSKLHKYQNGKYVAKRAKKNITVYKRLVYDCSIKKLSTPYQGLIVHLDSTLKATFSFSSCCRCNDIVRKGIHAYQTKTYAKKIDKDDYIIVVECTIPKNALYYLGIDKEIVATKMKLNKIIYGKSQMK